MYMAAGSGAADPMDSHGQALCHLVITQTAPAPAAVPGPVHQGPFGLLIFIATTAAH